MAKGKIKRICKQCGNEFQTFPFKIKNGHAKFCSKKCEGLSKRGKKLPKETKIKMGISQKKRFNEKSFQPTFKGKKHTLETKIKMSKEKSDAFRRTLCEKHIG